MPLQSVVDIQSPGALEEMKSLLVECIAVVVCPLYSSSEGSVRFYHSPTQHLSKRETDALRKAKREVAKALKKNATLDPVDLDPDPESRDPDQQEEGTFEGVGVLLVCKSNSNPLSKYARRAMAANPAASAAIKRSGGAAEPGPLPEDSTLGKAFYISAEQCSTSMARQRRQCQQQGPQDLQQAGPASSVAPRSPRQVLQDLLLSRRPIVCCDMKRLIRDLIKIGVVVPEGLRVADPCLLAWLSDPQQAREWEEGRHSDPLSYEIFVPF